jgi:GNAT superfamily N-acetyltransferase
MDLHTRTRKQESEHHSGWSAAGNGASSLDCLHWFFAFVGSYIFACAELLQCRLHAGGKTMTTATQLSIRTCTHDDIPVVVQMVQWAYRGGKESQRQWTGEAHLVKGPRITPEKLAALLDAQDVVVLICERTKQDGSKQIVGCIQCDKKGDDAHVGMLAVDPDEQSGGVGRTLMQAADDWARTKYGAKRMVGEIISGRPELMEWYKRQGYRLTGEKAPFFGAEHGVTPLVEGLHFDIIVKDL